MAGGLRRTAAALLVVLAAGVAFAPAAPARDVTALQATMTVGLKDNPIGGGFLSQNVGYIPPNGALNPSSFSVAGARYTVTALTISVEGTLANPVPAFLVFGVRGAVTTMGDGSAFSHVLPKGADITLHLEGTDWSKSYSLQNAQRSIESNDIGWEIGDVILESFSWFDDLPPLTEGEQVTVRLIHPPLPPAPANLRASPDDGEVALSWNAPASGVTRHEYRYKTDGSYPASWTAIPDSARGENYASGYTVARLVNGTAYTFQVRAVNDVGAGAAAESDQVTPAPPPFVPKTCTLNPGDVWCGTVTVGEVAEAKGKTIGYGFHETWHGDGVGYMHDGRIVSGLNSYRIDEAMVGVGVATAGDDRILFFSLNRALTAADRARLVLHIGSDTFAFSDAHFESSTHTYHWRNTGLDWSSTDQVKPRLRASPAAPTAVTASAPPRTGGLLEVTWSAPASAGSITGYEVKYWKAADPENRRSRTKQTGSTKTSFLLYPFLDADTEYKLRVRARDTIGRGAWSEVATARTGAKQRDKPILSLAVVDASGNDIESITEGGTFRYRVKVRELLNHHQSSGSDFSGWGTLGVRGPFAIDYIYRDGGKAGCHGRMLFLKDFTWISATTGYWEFDSADIPADAAGNGPLRLRMGFECTPKYAGASHEVDTNGDGENDTLVESGESDGAVTTTSDIFTLGSPDRACLSVADSEGTVMHACAAGEAGARSLKARFVSPPEQHDGKKRVKVRVAFSEAIEESPENVGEHGVRVEGGRVTSVRRVDNRPAGGAAGRSGDGQEDGESVWEFEIEPGSGEDLTMRIDAGRPCDEAGAICTADGRSLSQGIATTVEGPETGPPPLTAAFQGVPESHDGEDAFRFRVAFSEDIGIGFRSMRDASFTVSGGRVTKAKRVDRRKDLWEIKVEPETDGAVTITLPGGRECAVSGAICTRGGNRRQLANTPAATVAGPVDEAAPVALTASFVQAPAEHDGSSPFKLRVAFSEAIKMQGWKFRAYAVAAAGGRVTEAKRVDRRKDLWELTVRPRSYGDVVLTLAPGGACGETGAVCTPDGRALSAMISTTVLGPVALSVADARVHEAEDALLVFEVTLDRARHAEVTVDYATSDVTARAGEDYTSASGTLTFATGERSKTVEVTVLDDAHDEGEETLTLTLSNPSGAYLADATATGTIENKDHMPKAWMVRFGRTVGSQVVDALTQRLDGAGGSHVTVGGINLTGAPGVEPEAEAGDPFGLPEWAKQTRREEDAQTLTADDLLLRSAFHLSSGGGEGPGEGPAFTAWGRVSTGGFEAEEDDVTMDGDVTTGLVGFDAEWERALAGVMLSQSSGEGSYRLDPAKGDDAGTVESSLTGVYPYVRVDLNAKVSAWALAGIGSGELTLHQQGEKPMPTDISMRMGAVGVKGQVLDGTGASGLGVNVKSDAMWVGTKSSDTSELAPTRGDVTRLRLILQGERTFESGNGATFTPSAEVGLRRDGGDAETGTGLEVGAGLRYTVGAVTIEAEARTLLAHEASGYKEWGMSGAIRVTPDASGRGLTLSIAPAWGRTGSATERLWSAHDARALGADSEFEADSRLAIDAGYGFGLPGNRGVLTPYAGMTLGDAGHRAMRTGTRWQVSPDATFGLEASRQASDAGKADNQLMLRAALRF